MNNNEKILREAEDIAATREEQIARDIDNIHVALADYSKTLDIDGTIKITRITRYMDDAVELFSVYLRIEFLCGKCDEVHVRGTHAIVKRRGDDFVALDSELVMDQTEEEMRQSRAVVVRVPPTLFKAVKKKAKKKNKKKGEGRSDERE